MTGLEALKELRARRRQQRVAQTDWFEALYRAYLAAIVGSISAIVLAGWLGGDQVSATELVDVQARGPAVIGIVAALELAIGLRSGSRGGPLAVEPAEVRHVLLSPVDRRQALLAPAIRQLRFALFTGLVSGAIIGVVASRRLPGPRWEWAATGAVFGSCVAVLFVGAALCSSGFRLPRPLATALAIGLLGVAVGTVAAEVWSPFEAFGGLALWPLRIKALELVALGVAVVLVLVGISRLGRLALELAERRTALVGQLRFAATMRDVRTVMVLHRQLAIDESRTKPWTKWVPIRQPVARRSWRGLMRISAGRILRMLLLAGVGAVLIGLAARGNRVLVLASGLCFWLVGMELAEPLAQTIDRPDRSSLLPRVRGDLFNDLLLVPGIFGSLLGIPVALLAGGVAGGGDLQIPAALAGFATVLAGVAGGAVTLVTGAPATTEKTSAMMLPEVAGIAMVVKTARAPVVAILGCLPLILATKAGGRPAAGVALQGLASVGLILAFVAMWIQRRDRWAESWRAALNPTPASTTPTSGAKPRRTS